MSGFIIGVSQVGGPDVLGGPLPVGVTVGIATVGGVVSAGVLHAVTPRTVASTIASTVRRRVEWDLGGISMAAAITEQQVAGLHLSGAAAHAVRALDKERRNSTASNLSAV